MKKPVLFLLGIFILTVSCKKDPVIAALPINEQLAIDLEIIDNYLVDNTIENVLKDCRTIKNDELPCEGYVSYVLIEEGSGLFPPYLSTKITVSYVGRLLDTGEQFEAKDSVEFTLGNLIQGWQAVLLDMQEGDSVTMYIPSGYGYGYKEKTTNGIPSNANLIFDMKLHQVN